MLILLAKLGTPEMVGQFTFAFAVTAPLFMFTNLQLRVVQATDSKVQFMFNDYLALRLVASAVALLVIVGLSLFLPYGNTTATVVLIVGIAKAIESVSDVCYGLMQQQERMDFISVSLMVKGALSLLLLMMGVWVSGTVVGGVLGLALAWLMVFLLYDVPTTQQLMRRFAWANSGRGTLGVRWDWSVQRRLIGLSLPLGFVMLLVSLNINIPRYLIEHVLSPRELGIFGAIAYLMLVGSIIQGALSQAASPRLAKYYADGQRQAFTKLVFYLLGISFVMGGLGIGISWLFGKPLLTLLYDVEYAQYSGLLVGLMVAAALDYLSSFLGMAITAARYFRSQVPLFATTAGTLAIACYVLIPEEGLHGAAIAMILTGVLRCLLCFAILIYALKQPIRPVISPSA